MSHVSRLVQTRLIPLLLLTALSFCLLPASTSADDVRESSSLKIVPDDVAFYSTSLRLREQFDAIANSKAVASIKNMPMVQMGMFMAQGMWSNPQNPVVAQAKAALEQPENKQLIEALKDAVSQEVFVYGTDGYGDLVEMINAVNAAQREAQIAALREGGNAEELLPQMMLDAVTKSLDGFKLPDTVMGFKLSDAQAATAQIARLEMLLQMVAANQPELQNRVSKQKIGDTEYLTVQLDGSLIPWDEIYDELEGQREQLEKLAAQVTPMTLTVSLGVWNEYLILSFGDTGDHLKALGAGNGLASRPELAPLADYADRPIASVGYVSESFVKKASATDQQIESFIGVAQQLVPLAELEEQVEAELNKDIVALGDLIKSHLPVPGAIAGFSFITDKGYEGFQYNFGENPALDSSQPLTILNHVGGNPIMFIAARGSYNPECFDGMADVVERVVYYGEKIGLPRMDEGERELYQKMRDELTPLVKQLGAITSEKMIPAMRDSQGAFVLDAKSTSTQWHEEMPPSDEALPMLEMALVYGVSDANLVKEAAGEYFETIQAILEKLHELEPEEIPEIEMPAPDSRDFPGGTVYFYRLPKKAGLDKQVAPSAGLSPKVLALSMMPRQIQRLLESTDLQVDSTLDLDRPVASVVYFNWAGLIDAITPWVDYGMAQAMPDDPSAAAIKQQVQTGLNVLKCFRGVISVTYKQDNAWVSHFESRFADLP